MDSAMVYRGLDIGTAKPSIAVRRTVPHHLVDILEPN
jgi:tRNA dimethylallyltransferase